MLADYHRDSCSWLSSSKIMNFSSFLQWRSFSFTWWLEEATQKHLSISVFCSFLSGWGCKRGARKEKIKQTSPHVYFLVALPELVYVKPRNRADRAQQSWRWPVSLTALPAALPALHFSAQKVPKPPRLGNPVGKAKQAQATLSALSGPYGQHLCGRISSTSPCPPGPVMLRVGVRGAAGTYGTGTAEEAQPAFGLGRNVDCPEKIPPCTDLRKYVFFVSKQTMSHWLSHGRKWDYKECISK